MKKIISLLGIIIFVGTILSSVINGKPNTIKPSEKEMRTESPVQVINRDAKDSIQEAAIYKDMNCRTCHSYDYPTKAQPSLKKCPKDLMTEVHKKATEGPKVVVMDELAQRFGTVVFSHKLHASMSEFSGGCDNCHHYNTMGPIQKCMKCHEVNRKREDISKPDLKGAYHRQCMTCHREWGGKNDCNQCHIPKGTQNQKLIQVQTDRLAGVQHPQITAPPKRIFETKYNAGKIVTFYHDEHTQKFGLECKNCHKNDNCVKCHDKRNSITNTASSYATPVKVAKSHEEHHKQCITCHSKDKCGKCHSDKVSQEFSHGRISGFELTGKHASLTCGKCHKQTPPEKLNANCISCHKDFVLGKFDHAKTGLKLSDNHSALECETCHKDGKINKSPVCSDCHDDKAYPKFKPGAAPKAQAPKKK